MAKSKMVRRHGVQFAHLLVSMAALAPVGMGQVAAEAKAPSFDVVSIRPSNSGNNGGVWGVSQNRYFAKNTPLSGIILEAYLGETAASPDRLIGAPSWVAMDPYDITAKVDDATADSWKGRPQAQQVALVAPMLRTMLEDRCKLVAHTVPAEIKGYALVVRKQGAKLKQAPPGEPLPERGARFDGGWRMISSPPGPDGKQAVTYLQITMAQFAAFLSRGGTPIVDQTGLTGKYDFDLPRFDLRPPEAAEGAPPAPRLDVAHTFDWGAIGLELVPAKVPARNLVIDHIERPTEN